MDKPNMSTQNLEKGLSCAIITPIGPGHQDFYALCRESVLNAWATSQGVFSRLELLPMWDLEGQHGRSARRNDGLRQAAEKGCDWVFFLDADDMMHPQAFATAAPFLSEVDALWGAICEMSINDPTATMQLRSGQLSETGSLLEILRWDPALTLQMGHFVRTACALAVGFKESMDTGEDFRYYLRLWQTVRCFKQPEPLFINVRGLHSQGPRSADGGQWRRAVEQEIADVLQTVRLVLPVVCPSAQGPEGQTIAFFPITTPAQPIERSHCQERLFSGAAWKALASIHAPQPVRRVLSWAEDGGVGVVYLHQQMGACTILAGSPSATGQARLKDVVALNGLEAFVAPLESLDRLDCDPPHQAPDFVHLDLPSAELPPPLRRLLERCRPLLWIGGETPLPTGYHLLLESGRYRLAAADAAAKRAATEKAA